MTRSAGFWISMAVFQVVFGLAVFAITRDYYRPDVPGSVGGAAMTQAHPPEQRGQFSDINPALLTSIASGSAMPQDPVEISRQANQRFSERQYALAANLYEKLLTFDPGSVDTLNNLGLTLHYVGRSDEALARLDEAINIDPSYQRAWLTLGYVNGELGNAEPARAAFMTAVELNPDNDVGKSAARMLQNTE